MAEKELARVHAISTVTAAVLNSGSYDLNMLPMIVKQVSQALFGDNKPILAPTEIKEIRGKDGRILSAEPKVPIEDSVHDDYIVCLLDGMKFKSMKRHLTSLYEISPEEYRKLFSLPETYPLVCKNYANKRSHLAKNIKDKGKVS